MRTEVAAPAARTSHSLRKTRAIAEYALRQTKDDAAHLRMLALFRALAACENALARDPRAAVGRLAALRAAMTDVVGAAWLDGRADDPDVRALRHGAEVTTPSRLDTALANVLWARFAPTGA